MQRCRDPLHCLLTPAVLENIARKGDESQREWAVRALNRDQSIRMVRVQNAKVRGRGPREGADALAVESTAKPNRIIRDAEGSESVRGKITRREGDPPSGDTATDEAYEGFGETFNFFLEAYGRNSIDDEGMPLRGVIHFGAQYPNAFWDGKRMVFGDGDGQVLGRMTASLDVIGHELGHGVTEDEAALEYFGQSGALNESMSDVFGSLVKQHKLNQTADQADWLIGVDVVGPALAPALRSLKEPGTANQYDQQPGTMSDFVNTPADNGGVHINSGIPNRAFSIVATTLGGNAWEDAGRIWYEALRDPVLRPNATFRAFARITVRQAQRLYGTGAAQVQAVKDGWEAVEVAL